MIGASAAVRPALEEWMTILNAPVDDVLAILEGVDERSRELRQSSPFCGMLTTQERSEIFLQFEKDESAAA